MLKTSLECLIVGAGPVGLTLACQLQQYGISFRIIDKLDGPVIRTKAAAIWSRTAEFLQQMDLADKFVIAGLHCYGASIFADGKRFAHLSLEGVDSLYKYVMMVPQHTTESILRECLEKEGHSVEYGHKVQALEQNSDSVSVQLESGEKLSAQWVFGCDGAHSGVRQALNLDFQGEQLESQWVVADLYILGLPIDDEVLVYMHRDGPTALFPLGGQFYRMVGETNRVADISDDDKAQDDIRRIIESRVGGTAKVKKIAEAGYFTISERQVSQYRVGRVFLAGDSAHIHSPLGGQGMNTGMHDVHNLAWKIAMVARGRMKPELLDSYHEERHPIGKWLVETTSRGTKLITSRQPLVQALRNQAGKILANLPIVRNKIRDTLTEVELNYRERSLSQEPETLPSAWHFKKGVKAGDRAPDAEVQVDGEQRRLSHYLKGCHFHLLLFGGAQDSWSAFGPLVEMVRKDYPQSVKILWVGANNAEPYLKKGETFLYDHNHELHHDYAATEDCAYLIRPDAYVAHRSQPVSLAELRTYLQIWFLK